MIQSFLTILFLTLSTHAGVSSVGQGGDVMAIEFKETAKEILATLSSSSSKPDFNLKFFATTIETSKVESTDEKLYLDGLPKDAINYRDTHKIIFNRTAWSNSKGTATRSIFVLHEFLGLMGVEDQRYDVSSKMIKTLYPGSLTCQSILTRSNDTFNIIHTEVLVASSGRVEAHWQTQGYAIGVYYSPNNSVQKPNLSVTLDELKQDRGHMFKSAINVWNPYLSIFVDLGKGTYSFIEVECKLN